MKELIARCDDADIDDRAGLLEEFVVQRPDLEPRALELVQALDDAPDEPADRTQPG